MITKVKRLSTALWMESVKRLPYIGLILILLLLYQGYQTAAKVSENVGISKKNSEDNMVLLREVAALSEANKKLSEDNKKLSEQSNELAAQSIRYQDCIARIFAKYTRDYKPVIIRDLEGCVTTNTEQSISTRIPTPQSPPPASGSQPPQSPPSSNPTPSQPGNSGTHRNQPQKQSPSQPPQPSIFERIMNTPRGLLNLLQSML